MVLTNRTTLKRRLWRSSQNLVTFLGASLFLFSNAFGANLTTAQVEAIEGRYRACLELRLTSADLAELSRFREKFLRQTAALNAIKDPVAYEQAFRQLMPQVIHPKLQPRYLMIVAERGMYEKIALKYPALHSVYQKYMTMVVSTMMSQNVVDMNEMNRLHNIMAAAIASKPDALFALNVMSQQIAEVQLDNARIAGDRARIRSAIGWQAAYAVGGMALLGSTFLMGPVGVARAGYVAYQLGTRVVYVQTGVGMSVGAAGGGGVGMGTESSMVFVEASYRSMSRGTPFQCEFERADAYSDPGKAFLTGMAMGIAAGGIGTAATHSARLSEKVMILTSWTIKGGLAHEVGYAGYEAYQLIQLSNLSGQLKALQVPESARDVQEALIKSVDAEFDKHFLEMVRHGFNAAVIYTLYHFWFPHGEYEAALKGGIERAKMVMAPSADTIPSVVKSGIELGKNGVITGEELIRGTTRAAIESRARQFILSMTRTAGAQ